MRKSIEIVTLLILLFMKCTTANFLEYDDCIGWGLDVGRRRGSTKTKNDHPSKHKDATTFVRNLEPVKHHRKRTIPSKKLKRKVNMRASMTNVSLFLPTRTMILRMTDTYSFLIALSQLVPFSIMNYVSVIPLHTRYGLLSCNMLLQQSYYIHTKKKFHIYNK